VALINIQAINSLYDKWSELRKQAIMTSEATYWNKPLWQVKPVTGTSHY